MVIRMNIIREESKVSLNINNNELAYMKYDLNDNILKIIHTYVSDALRGQGIAGKLINEVINICKENNYKIVPICSYAVKFFEKNTQYNDLLKK